MNPRSHVVENNLKRTAARWRWLHFLQHSSTLGAIICLLFLTTAFAVRAGWTPEPIFLTSLEVVLVLGAALVWFSIALIVVSRILQRSWLAGLLERGQPKLMDRVNTLVHLEKNARRNASVRAFYLRIAKQAQGVLAGKSPPIPLSPARAMAHLAVFLALLMVTIFAFNKISPHERLRAAHEAALAAQNKPKPEVPPEIALPTNNLVEQKQPWGEVRITEPGRDMSVTKMDVVPLQIEAAANEPLQKIHWNSALNGASEKTHDLPPPTDPRYAVYKPTLSAEQMGLSDWDVLTYYAKARTEGSNSFASEVYFVEVRPFREDLVKSAAEGGQAYECLNELTTLINRQQEIIRQTHQHIQKPQEQTKLQSQDRAKLAEAEADLSQSANHLQARMSAGLINKPAEDALNQLAKAEKDAARASDSLRADALPDAQSQERSALSDLVAARKKFQKVITENPDAFAGKSEEEPPPGKADQDKLREMAEFRDEAKAAQDFVQKSLQKQQQLAQKSRSTPGANLPELAEQEKQIEQSLDQFQNEHPKPFRDVPSETTQAEKSLAKAAEAFQKKSVSGRTNAQEAVKELQKLAEAMKDKSEDRQLSDAYKLKQMLDKQIECLGQCQKSGDSISNGAMRKTVSEARQTLRQLKNVAEQQPTRDAFGPKLRESLNDPNMLSLNWPLSELESAQDKESKERAAGQAKEGLSKVSQAFTESEPQALQEAQKTDSLKPGEEEGLERGLAELQKLIKQLEEKQQLSPENQSKEGGEALFNLQTGLRSRSGNNSQWNQIMIQLERELKKGETPIELENLKKLIEQIQNFSLETSVLEARKDAKPEVTNIDPERLPPAYRGRIEKYFQKLSEK